LAKRIRKDHTREDQLKEVGGTREIKTATRRLVNFFGLHAELAKDFYGGFDGGLDGAKKK